MTIRFSIHIQYTIYNIHSGVGHAAAGALINGVSGGDEQDGVMYDEQGYDEQYDNNNYSQSDLNQHPCMKYWEQFQTCMNMNSDDISGCQNLYNVFNRCQKNPDGML